MRYIILNFLLLFSSHIFSQTEVQSINLDLKSGGSGFFFGIGEGSAEIIPFSDNEATESIICIRDKKELYFLVFSEKFELLDKLIASTPEFSTLKGGFVKNNKVILIYTTNRDRTIQVQEFDIETSQSEIVEFGLRKKEKYIKFIEENNRCYLITSQKNTSIVSVYAFNDYAYDDHIDFELDPIQINGQQWPFYYIFEKDPSFISQSTPSSFSQTSSLFKIYVDNDEVLMTIDKKISYTEVIRLNLKTKAALTSKFEKTFENCDFLTNNSLIHKGSIFLLSICKSEIYLDIRNLNSGLNLNSFFSTKDEDIHFRNSNIIQEGGGTIYSQDRTLQIGETKKFLNKASKLKAALTIEDASDFYSVDIGASKEITQTSGGGGGYSPGGSFSTPYGSISTPGTYNNVYGSYQSSTWNKSIYFTTYLDKENFKHLLGNSYVSIYDRIRDYESEIDESIKIKNVFKYKNDLYFCYYIKKDDKLKLVRFKL